MSNYGKCPVCKTPLANAKGLQTYCPKKGCPVGFDIGVGDARRVLKIEKKQKEKIK